MPSLRPGLIPQSRLRDSAEDSCFVQSHRIDEAATFPAPDLVRLAPPNGHNPVGFNRDFGPFAGWAGSHKSLCPALES